MKTRNSLTLYITNSELYTNDDIDYLNGVITEMLSRSSITTPVVLTSLDFSYITVNSDPNPLYGKVAIIHIPFDAPSDSKKWYRSAGVIFHKDLHTEGMYERFCLGTMTSLMKKILNTYKDENGLVLQKMFTDQWPYKRGMFKYNSQYSNETVDHTPDLIYTVFGKVVSFLTRDKQISIDQYEVEKKELVSTVFKDDDKIRMRIKDKKIPRTHVMHIVITNV